ncbi:MAG: histidinol dehydrogenase [Cytophagales bacterium]|nr:MAG: histidinol dehydrogenase [Cytophagales bacterium]TAF59493.1 MAG: histidinol dehydrogenase [Cytophagales bacterium]
MPKIYINPPRQQWLSILQRPAPEQTQNQDFIRQLFEEVQREGDHALKRYALALDKFEGDWLVTEQEFEAAEALISVELKSALELAYQNIYRFHQAELPESVGVETMQGVWCERRAFPIEKVGLYIPGGSAPLFSTVLMLGIPAQLAGCAEVVLCSPPQPDGSIHPAILYAAKRCNIQKVLKIGGAQAIAGMALGTASVPKCSKLFGPGNRWVTAAKQYASSLGTAIDMPAGPSEVLVLADQTANPVFVAADLLAQAEHGSDSQVLLVSTHKALLQQVEQELEKLSENLSRRSYIQQTLQHSCLIYVPNRKEAIDLVNLYAPEHLIIQSQDEQWYTENVRNAGSVFLGDWSPESVGDYASGTNHTLPTAGFAEAWSGVSVESFMKFITFQKLSPEGLRGLGTAVETLAHAETLEAHALAVSVRLSALKTKT